MPLPTFAAAGILGGLVPMVPNHHLVLAGNAPHSHYRNDVHQNEPSKRTEKTMGAGASSFSMMTARCYDYNYK